MENNIKEELFHRVYANTCPLCGHDTLWLVEYECTKNRLNDQGVVIESYTDGYQTKLQCVNCGESFNDVTKRGMSYRIKSTLPPVRKVMKDFNPFQSNNFNITEIGEF